MNCTIIPIFIPHYGCPHACVFCNQRRITGQEQVPDDAGIKETIEKYLQTIAVPRGGHVEVAFYGGSFTALGMDVQERYLRVVQPYIESGEVASVRVSTRPDAINPDILELLRSYRVGSIELGVQSLDEEVLQLAGRGYTVDQVWEVVALVKAEGFALGIQLMLGLPGDSREKDVQTARAVTGMKPDMARLYPALVIRDTRLAVMYRKGTYRPLSLEEAVVTAADMFVILEGAGTKVIRMGLQPTLDLTGGEALVAGPFHPSFGELVEAEVFLRQALAAIHAYGDRLPDSLCLFVNQRDASKMIGHRGRNRKRLKEYWKTGELSIVGIESPERNWVGLGASRQDLPRWILHREEFYSMQEPVGSLKPAGEPAGGKVVTRVGKE